ncbi:unnamed protein product, partial [marine sediment metagenome]
TEKHRQPAHPFPDCAGGWRVTGSARLVHWGASAGMVFGGQVGKDPRMQM